MSRPLELLALDVEGTLVSNAVSRVPRPGLHDFLEFCRAGFPRMLVYTGVDERRFRELARQLVAEGAAPGWFADVKHVPWTGAYKDLGSLPDADVATSLLVDDMEACVHPEQLGRWVRIQPFDRPYPDSDAELSRVMAVLAAHLAGIAGA